MRQGVVLMGVSDNNVYYQVLGVPNFCQGSMTEGSDLVFFNLTKWDLALCLKMDKTTSGWIRNPYNIYLKIRYSKEAAALEQTGRIV